MNGVSLFARSMIQREAVNTFSYTTASVGWDNFTRWFGLSSSFCDEDADGWVEMVGDGYVRATGGRAWFAGWDEVDTVGPEYNTGGYLAYDVIFPLNSGTGDWPTLRQIGVFGQDSTAGNYFIYGVQPDPTFKIGSGQRLVLLGGDNIAATHHTAGLIASNGIPEED